jgi:valyl-tRNA synthetase
LHGTVRDAKGRKMSKSLDNGVDPIEITNKFGADAGRMALVVANTPGTDSRWTDDKVKAYKNFANKIWNITRFILESSKDAKIDDKFNSFSEIDSKLIEERTIFVKDITKDMDEYRFYMAGEKIYHYVWHTFADIILEESKKIFSGGHNDEKKSRVQFLLSTLRIILKTLHPFMPFLTEEIWQTLGEEKLLMIEEWPK